MSHDTGRRQKTITKAMLYFRAMRFFFGMGAALAALTSVIVLVVPLFAYSPLSFWGRILVSVVTTALFLLGFIVIGTLHLLPGFFRIAKQEKLYGFRFRDEMQAERIIETESVSPNWFISVRASGVVAFRKGFITKIGKVDKYYRSATKSRIIATDTSGSTMKIVGRFEVKDKLQKWLKGTLPR